MIMKRYYNATTSEWYTEGSSMTEAMPRDGFPLRGF